MSSITSQPRAQRVIAGGVRVCLIAVAVVIGMHGLVESWSPPDPPRAAQPGPRTDMRAPAPAAGTSAGHDATPPLPVVGDVAPEPSCEPPDDLDVLFVGNSYTRMYDLPGLVERLGEQAGISLDARMLAVGGKNFDYHRQRDETERTLASADWDIVVLQSHSLDTLRNLDGFIASGLGLIDMVRAYGATPLLFETWARGAGHRLYRHGRAVGEGPDAMQRKVHRRYERLADIADAEIVHVGDAWRATRRLAPDVDLYASDDHHPGRLGAYLTANVMFAAITDVSPLGNVGPPLLGIDRETATLLQAQAAALVEPACEDFADMPGDGA